MRDIQKKQTDRSEYKVINGDRVKVGRRKRRNKYTLYYYLAFFVVVVTITLLSVTILFNATEIEITGTDLYSAEQIRQISGVEVGDNLIRLDAHTAEDCVLNTLSYVEDIKVLRNFPDKISIRVTQAVAQMNIEYGGKYYVISDKGKILEAGLEKPKTGLITVKGFELNKFEIGENAESDDTLKPGIVKTIISTIEQTGMKNIVEINITDRTDIKLNYESRINILLGSSLDLEYKLNAVRITIDSKIEKDFNGVIYYLNDASGVSVIASDKLSGSLVGEAPSDYSKYDDDQNSDLPLQDKFNNGLK